MFDDWRDFAALPAEVAANLKAAMEQEGVLPENEIPRVMGGYCNMVSPNIPASTCAACGVMDVPLAHPEADPLADPASTIGINSFVVVSFAEHRDLCPPPEGGGPKT